MSVSLYMDHNVSFAIARGLRGRGVDVITAAEDGAAELDDSVLLDRAGELGRVLFSGDDDLLAEGRRRQRLGIPFHGVIYAHQLDASVGKCVKELEVIAKAGDPVDFTNVVWYL